MDASAQNEAQRRPARPAPRRAGRTGPVLGQGDRAFRGQGFREKPVQSGRPAYASRAAPSALRFGASLEKASPRPHSRGQAETLSRVDVGGWNPANLRGVLYGTGTLRVALAHSLNARPQSDRQTGTAAFIEFARRAGIQNPLEKSGIALGISELSLLELTVFPMLLSPTAAFASLRINSRPVVDAEGGVLETSHFGTIPPLLIRPWPI